jgi:hypothetical protein
VRREDTGPAQTSRALSLRSRLDRRRLSLCSVSGKAHYQTWISDWQFRPASIDINACTSARGNVLLRLIVPHSG